MDRPNAPIAASFRLHRAFIDSPVATLAPSPVVTVPVSATVYLAIEKLIESKQGALCVIGQDGILQGIFTERDVVKKVRGSGSSLQSEPVSRYMTVKPEVLKKSASIARAIYLMAVGGFRNIPIVGSDGRPTHIVSVKDFVDFLYRRLGSKVVQAGGVQVADRSEVEFLFASPVSSMAPPSAVVASADTPIPAVLELLRSRGMGSVLVQNDIGHVAGIFTERDYLLKVALSMIAASKRTLEECMTERPTTVLEGATVAMAFSLLSEGGFRHLPVVDEMERLKGVLSVRSLLMHLSDSILKEIS